MEREGQGDGNVLSRPMADGFHVAWHASRRNEKSKEVLEEKKFRLIFSTVVGVWTPTTSTLLWTVGARKVRCPVFNKFNMDDVRLTCLL